MDITNDIKYVGINDKKIDLFESQYVVPKGISYNSYVIIDKKIMIADSVDNHFTDEWLGKIANVLEGKKPEYLLVSHMEPDHSGSIYAFMNKYPDTKIVSSAKSFVMMKQFFGTGFADNQVVVGQGSTLSLGNHELTFITAPMVHWPEVIMTYDAHDKVLFSADGFGKFGALDDCIVNDEWDNEAARYYFGIVGKYGAQVQAVLKKAAALEINKICSLHGPILSDKSLENALKLYDTWSSYKAEKDGVFIAYSSIYGHTKQAAERLCKRLSDKGCKEVVIADLARSDMSECISSAFRYSKLIIATPTYNAGVFPHMHTFINSLTERNFQSRTIGIIENGSWAPTAANAAKKLFESSKSLNFIDTVTIKGSLTDENNVSIDKMAEELI